MELAEDAPQCGIIAANSEPSESALQELEGVDGVPEGAVAPERPRRSSLFGGLFGRKSDAQDNEETFVELENKAAKTEPEVDSGNLVLTNDPTLEVAEPVDKPRRKGLFAMFDRKGKNSETNQAIAELPEAEQAAPQEAAVELASLSRSMDNTPKPRRGLFGPRRSKSTVEAGVQLPFGELGIACGIRGNALGKEVDRFPQKGKGYRLYDTNPSSTSPRTFFVTGFKDRCPRQFTAAMAMLDTPVMHEQMRYGRSNKSIPMTKTDTVYEGLKQRVCKAGRGKPCPESHIEALEKTTAYVSAYPRLGTNANWFEILLNKGKVAASSKRSR
ncbi:TPA: hypothetical protein EYP12_08995 [Candidatus Bipolaricaulota bacterium]|nr:hypothetical protein [Candidatus Bipolaricaulota bacterium]